MLDWQEKLMAQLNEDKPDWWIEWANQSDFQSWFRGETENQVRNRVANRLFHTILHAAIGAGIVTEVKDA